MGRRVAALATRDPRIRLVAGIVGRADSTDGAPFPVAFEGEASKYFGQADAIVDFSNPTASVRYSRLAARIRRPIVIGTTGFQPSQLRAIKLAARRVPVLLSPNFSPGMNLLFDLATRSAAALAGFVPAIVETHHAGKKDAPSGSALKLAEAVRSAGTQRRTIPITSRRIGTVVGEHALAWEGPFERVELVHRARSRDTFARGALDAALWIRRRAPGFYDMGDVLGL